MGSIEALVKKKLGMSLEDFERHLSLASCETSARVKGNLSRETAEIELIIRIRRMLDDSGMTVADLADKVPMGVDTLYKFLSRKRSLSEPMFKRLSLTTRLNEHPDQN